MDKKQKMRLAGIRALRDKQKQAERRYDELMHKGFFFLTREEEWEARFADDARNCVWDEEIDFLLSLIGDE